MTRSRVTTRNRGMRVQEGLRMSRGSAHGVIRCVELTLHGAPSEVNLCIQYEGALTTNCCLQTLTRIALTNTVRYPTDTGEPLRARWLEDVHPCDDVTQTLPLIQSPGRDQNRSYISLRELTRSSSPWFVGHDQEFRTWELRDQTALRGRSESVIAGWLGERGGFWG